MGDSGGADPLTAALIQMCHQFPASTEYKLAALKAAVRAMEVGVELESELMASNKYAITATGVFRTKL